MFDNVQGRLTQIARDYPAVVYVAAIGAAAGGVAAVQKVMELKRWLLDDTPRQSDPPEQPAPRPGHGALLDGLVLLPPRMDLSACERLGSFVGVPVHEQTEKDRNFQRLLRVCQRLPAEVPNAPPLQDRLDSLRDRVKIVSHAHYGVLQRGDGLDAIVKLWREAQKLEKRLKAHAGWMRRQRPADSGSTTMGRPVVHLQDRATGTGTRRGRDALPDTVLRRRTVERRQPAAADAEVPVSRPAPRARVVVLRPQQIQALRDAITRAWEESNRGGGVLDENQSRRLGVAITGVIGGSFPTHLAHSGRQARQDTVEYVSRRATERMPAPYRDAVRQSCGEVLEELAEAW